MQAASRSVYSPLAVLRLAARSGTKPEMISMAPGGTEHLQRQCNIISVPVNIVTGDESVKTELKSVLESLADRSCRPGMIVMSAYSHRYSQLSIFSVEPWVNNSYFRRMRLCSHVQTMPDVQALTETPNKTARESSPERRRSAQPCSGPGTEPGP